jgi:hypothetical protein
MPRVTRSAALLTIAAASLWLAAGPAAATRTIKVPSRVSIHSNSLRFSGKVSVPQAYEPCREDRKVVLFKVVSGGPDQAVGRDTTDGQGAWTITPQGSAGISLAHFYAKVKQRSDGTAGTIYVCQAARSQTVKPTT